MLIVLLILAIILIVVSVIFDDYLYDDFSVIGFGVGVILTFVSIIGMLISAGIIVNGRTYDAKIEMYTEENTVIEEQIDELVTEYMRYESETLTKLKGDSSISLVSLYPELKSDELIQKQINTYLSNNNKIKELKEKLINVSNAKWWLYFGG